MGIRNSSFWLVNFLLLLVSCTSVEQRREVTVPFPAARSEPRPPSPEGIVRSEPPRAAEPLTPDIRKPVEAPKVGILLGPGGVKTLSQLGFLDELRKSRVPIDRITGVEWGSLMGFLYAADGQSHAGEWWAYKLKNEDLVQKWLFSKQWTMQSPEEFLNDKVDTNFRNKSWRSMAIKFECPSRAVFGGRLAWNDAGKGSVDLAPCFAFPPLFNPADVSWAPISIIDSAIERLKKLGANLIVIVNVLERGSLFDKVDSEGNLLSVMIWEEVRNQWLEARERLKTRPDVFWVDISSPEQKLFRIEDSKSLVSRGREQGRKAAKDLVDHFQF